MLPQCTLAQRSLMRPEPTGSTTLVAASEAHERRAMPDCAQIVAWLGSLVG